MGLFLLLFSSPRAAAAAVRTVKITDARTHRARSCDGQTDERTDGEETRRPDDEEAWSHGTAVEGRAPYSETCPPFPRGVQRVVGMEGPCAHMSAKKIYIIIPKNTAADLKGG